MSDNLVFYSSVPVRLVIELKDFVKKYIYYRTRIENTCPELFRTNEQTNYLHSLGNKADEH